MIHHPSVEILEDRIAPATLLNPYTVTYQDIDGDKVLVKITKPLFTPSLVNSILHFSIGGVDNSNDTPQALDVINLTDTLPNIQGLGLSVQGLGISVTVLQKVGTGDGQANVGAILAATLEGLYYKQNSDLSNVTIQGDLGQIIAGDDYSSTAIQSLTVKNLGVFRSAGQNDQLLTSSVLGPISNLHIKGDLVGGLELGGAQYGSIKTLKIDGALRGISGAGTTGLIFFSGTIGNATIGSIVGADGAKSGSLVGHVVASSPAAINKLHVLGDIAGGAGATSGGVFAVSIGSVQVDGSINGGAGSDSGSVQGVHSLGSAAVLGSVNGAAGEHSGYLFSGSSLKSVTIGGSLTGGQGQTSGAVLANGSLNNLSIGQDMIGANSGSSAVSQSGFISANHIGNISIGGSLKAGSKGASSIVDSGAIRSSTDIGSITIGGDMTGDASNPVVISAAGISKNLAINKVVIGGDMNWADILAGYSDNATTLGKAANGDAQINSVIVRGALAASNIVAGVDAGPDGFFGTADDIAIASNNSSQILSKISSIVVEGNIGPSNSASKAFGIVAQYVKAASVHSTAVALLSGAQNDIPPGIALGSTNVITGLHVMELAPSNVIHA